MSRNIAQHMLFQRVQQDLVSIKGVKSSLIASRDGFLLSRSAEPNLEKYARASSAMLRTADAVTSKMGKECSERIVVDYPAERLIAKRAGPKVFVAVLTGPSMDMEPVLTELDQAARKIQEII